MLSLSRKPCLEIEIKAEQQFARVDVVAGQSNQWSGSILMQPIVFVVPGKASPAGHERVVAIAHGVGGNVAQVGWVASQWVGGVRDRCLLRHADSFKPADENQLRTVNVVRLQENTVPRRCPG